MILNFLIIKMLKLITKQLSWGVLGSVFTFLIGFFIKTYVIRQVGTVEWGRYATAHTFVIFVDGILSLGLPLIILKFMPDLIVKSRSMASQFIRKILVYALFISFLFLVCMYFLSPLFDKYIYVNTHNFSYLLLIVSIHAPISILMGIIISLYRSVLKIKEIIIYGTFISVPLRALLTILVFQYTNNIIYFVIIEIFTQLLVLTILYYLFNKNELEILFLPKDDNYITEKHVITYGKNVYANSLISLFSTQSLSLILGIMLPAKQMGVYSILLTISGLVMFLNKNLRKIFAPAISKLFANNKINELSDLYKSTTFLINLFTIPLGIITMLFADEILSLFSLEEGELLRYKYYLFVLVLARMISLFIGNSKTLMIMSGLEKQELLIQSFRSIAVIILSLLLIKKYELLAVVILFISSLLFVGIFQFIYMKKDIKVNPFSTKLLLLILLSVPCVYFAIIQNFIFQYYHFILIPTAVYFLYISIFYNTIKKLYKGL